MQLQTPYQTTPTGQAVLVPAELPVVWPLKGPGIADKAAFKAHMQRCDKGDQAAIQAELQRCMLRQDYWVMTYCFTKDEHDSNQPVKRFPRYKYIPFIIRRLCHNPKVAIPKSRQVMITWTVLAYILGQCLFKKHRLWFIQSKKEEDAAALIERAKHMYEHLPWWQRAAAPLTRPLMKQPFNKLVIANGSKMWGVPQGSDILRQYTASGIFGDEYAFQDKAEDAYTAAKPTVDGGGQIIAVSSVNGKNFFYRLVSDQMRTSEVALR